MFGGFLDAGSIESTRVNSDEAWTVIYQSDNLANRRSMNVALIGSSSILVFGGYGGGFREDGLVLETEKNTVR